MSLCIPSEVADVSFRDLDTLQLHIKALQEELEHRESASGYCWHDVARREFGERCDACDERIKILHEEMRMLYRDMIRLQKEESARVLRHSILRTPRGPLPAQVTQHTQPVQPMEVYYYVCVGE